MEPGQAPPPLATWFRTLHGTPQVWTDMLPIELAVVRSTFGVRMARFPAAKQILFVLSAEAFQASATSRLASSFSAKASHLATENLH